MPPTFICVDATIDGKKVGGDSGVFMLIGDADERTCREILLAFLHGNGYGDANDVLPEGSTIVLRCVKMNDARLRSWWLPCCRPLETRIGAAGSLFAS